jgi:DNA-binding winged helix-turn-helix (wHTH) protein/Tol biopolymer transport system component
VATGLNGNLAGVVRFGVYEVDPQSGELRRNGVKVKLQEQPFQVLTMLLERPGEVVSREDLQRRLWPADTFVDFDHSLNAAIKRLRDALRDSADNPRFVETLARRGYRFMAPVAGALPANGGREVQSASESRRPRRWIYVMIPLVIASCVAAGWRIGHRTGQPVAPREVRLTANSPDVPVEHASLSPDGRLLAYTDPRGLFLREMSREDSHQIALPGDLKAHFVSWYPDGSHLLVGGGGDAGTASLWNVPILGGNSRKVSDQTESGTISPDGLNIAFLRGGAKIDGSELWLMNVDGTQARKLSEIVGYADSIAWSPNNRRVAYLKNPYWHGDTRESRIESYNLADGKISSLYSDYRLQTGLSWARDGRVYFTRSEENTNAESNVYSVRADEETGQSRGELTKRTSGPDWKLHPQVTADGKYLTFLRSTIAPTVYVADVDTKTKQLEGVRRLTLDENRSTPYEWTADGAAVLYVSDRDGEFHIYRQTIGAASPELLVDGHDSPILLRLNPDASEILYESEPNHASEAPAPRNPEFQNEKVRLMHAPVNGGAGQQLLEADGMVNFQCARAPSRMCLFSRVTKDALVFTQFDAITGETKELFRTGDTGWQSYNWTLAPDGKLLALCKRVRVPRDTVIRLISLSDRSERVIALRQSAAVLAIDWAADGKSFWASTQLPGGIEALANIDLQGDLKPVLQDSKPYIGWAIPSRDGKHLAMWRSTGGSNVWMLDGF